MTDSTTPTAAPGPDIVASADQTVARRGAGSRSPVFTTSVLVALATVYVVWGSTYFAIRLALESYPPFLQGGIRFLIAGTMLLTFLRWRGRPLPTARQWRDGAVVGVL